jgi:hypothetical protein
MWSWLYGKLQIYAAIAGAVIVALLYAFLKGKARGKADMTGTLSRTTQKLDETFHQIDGVAPDFDLAVGNLRKRAQRRRSAK